MALQIYMHYMLCGYHFIESLVILHFILPYFLNSFMKLSRLSVAFAMLVYGVSLPAQTADSLSSVSPVSAPSLSLDQDADPAPSATPTVRPYKVMDDLTFVGIPVFAAGALAKGEKRAFRVNQPGNNHTLLTSFKTRIDDYSQFFGPAMATGLKLAGVEGRSNWPRYLVSAGLSYAFMGAFVNSIKYTAKEMRPDGSTANSWPSGHTATAFVGATILHKEYGSRSPWFSVAGYGVATATGVMRVLNNRHWVSDVLSGAGIGIMSGELAYALSDLIFKDYGLVRGCSYGNRMTLDKPSFFAISMGVGLGSRNLDFDMDSYFYDEGDTDSRFNLKFGASTAVSAEGAYFFNKYIGVGGRLRVNVAPINGWDGAVDIANDEINAMFASDVFGFTPAEQVIYDAGIKAQGTPGMAGYSPALVEKLEFNIKSDHLSEFATDLGLYFSLPLTDHLALGSKLLVGRSVMQEVDLNVTIFGGKRNLVSDDYGNLTAVTASGETYDEEWDYLTVSANNSWKFGTGISLTYAYKENYAFRLFCDYDLSRKKYTMTYNPGSYYFEAVSFDGINISDLGFSPEDFIERESIRKFRHTFIFGGSFSVLF